MQFCRKYFNLWTKYGAILRKIFQMIIFKNPKIIKCLSGISKNPKIISFRNQNVLITRLKKAKYELFENVI